MIKCLIRHALRIAKTVNGSYTLATIIVSCYFVASLLLKGGIEHLIFGETFHRSIVYWFIVAAFWAYLTLILNTCHSYNKSKKAFR